MADINILILNLLNSNFPMTDELCIKNHILTVTECHSNKEFCRQLKTGSYLTAIVFSDTLPDKIRQCLKFSPLPVILVSCRSTEEILYSEETFNNCIVLNNNPALLTINSVLEGLCHTYFTYENREYLKTSNDAVGTLAGGIAHEFNNMLGSIVGYSELIIEELSDSSPLREYAGRILKISDKAKDLIKSMLMISREPDTPSESVSMETIIRQVVEEVTSQSSKPPHLETHITAGSYTTRGNETHLKQMVKNVLNNALQAIEHTDGTVSIYVDRASEEEIHTHNELENGNYLIIKIRDTGEGIDKQYLTKIFNPFFTTRDPGQGTGLGLPIARSIAKSLGGTIEIEDSSAKGTTTNIYLPLLDVGPVIYSDKTFNINKILIVDDEKDLASITQKLLNKKGYDTLVATSGYQGLEIFKKNIEQVDLIITDIIMPDMNGAELISEIQKLKQNIPVIVMTGFMENLSMLDGLHYNAQLDKPVHFGSLLQEIEKIIYKQE